SVVRYQILFHYYHGFGDAYVYYKNGLSYVKDVWMLHLDFTNFSSTKAVEYRSGFILGIIGPSMLGEFTVFSMFSLIGLFFMLKAFKQNYPNTNPDRYAWWLFFWPSLWYWRSATGKDSLILLSVGLFLYGYV